MGTFFIFYFGATILENHWRTIDHMGYPTRFRTIFGSVKVGGVFNFEWRCIHFLNNFVEILFATFRNIIQVCKIGTF